MHIRTYADKSNTIVRGSSANLALNPVMELNYGKMLTRGLIHFPCEKVRGLIDDGTIADTSMLRHTLHMTNAASVNDRRINCGMDDSHFSGRKLRAVSYDLIFFRVPYDWDAGRGFDYVKDLYDNTGRGFSSGGSNWYNYRSRCRWDEEGIYSTDRLSKELDLFTAKSGNKSDVIFAYQHFDMGNEPVSVDVTDIFNSMIAGDECNNGFGIAFSPKYEECEENVSQYVGMFTGHTRSLYEPFIHTEYDNPVADDRLNFCKGRTNRLYFFAASGGMPINLDSMPKASINGEEYEVKSPTKGAYYIEVADRAEFEPDTMYFDTWSGLSYNGYDMGEVELRFVPKNAESHFTLGIPQNNGSETFKPYVYGIGHREKIRRGDIRKVSVECKIPYTSKQTYSEANIEYRLYTKNGESEIDIYGYSPTERAYDMNYFLIRTEDLIPSRYYIDIRVRYGIELLYHRDLLEFDIVNDETERYD